MRQATRSVSRMGLIRIVAVLLSLTARVGASGSIQPPHAQLAIPTAATSKILVPVTSTRVRVAP
jgi:hypothetical protein